MSPLLRWQTTCVVPAPMWAGPGADAGRSRRRCGPVPAQMWASPGADVDRLTFWTGASARCSHFGPCSSFTRAASPTPLLRDTHASHACRHVGQRARCCMSSRQGTWSLATTCARQGPLPAPVPVRVHRRIERLQFIPLTLDLASTSPAQLRPSPTSPLSHLGRSLSAASHSRTA